MFEKDGMATYSTFDDQQLLDLAFRDLDTLLNAREPLEQPDIRYCINCRECRLSYNCADSSYPGSTVCDDCGAIQPGLVYYETMYGHDLPTKTSNYKRIHHWHERISQLLLCESAIPPHQMLQIAEKLCDGTYTVISKHAVRAVLRSLNMQQYIEKWLQIIYRITNIAPPAPGVALVRNLDDMFIKLQEPFECHRETNRKNFLNYNYIFCRLLQLMNCTQYCMFFPLISENKIRHLDGMWKKMTETLDWEFKPLELVDPFAVRLEQPSLLLQRLGQKCASELLVVPRTVPLKMVCRTLDRRSLNRLIAAPKPRRSDRSESPSQKGAVAKKRRRCVWVKHPQSLNLRKFRKLCD